MLRETKPPRQSLTIWAGGVTTAASLAVLALRAAGVEASVEEVAAIIAAGITTVTGVLAVVGRLRAKAQIER